jgi:hypothetical protein
MCYNALWIDDTRPQPEDDEEFVWANARSFHEAIVKLELLDFDHVSFADDLKTLYGEQELSGYDVALWLVIQLEHGETIPTSFDVHNHKCPEIADLIQGVIDNQLT